MNWPKAIFFVFLFGAVVYACGSSEPKPQPAPAPVATQAPAQPEATPVDNLSPTEAEQPPAAEPPAPIPPAPRRKPVEQPSPTRTRPPARSEPAPTAGSTPVAGEVSQSPQAEPAPPASQDPVIVPSPPRRPQETPDETGTVPDDQAAPIPSKRRDQPAPSRATKVVLREGTAIEVRMTRTLSSDLNQTGDRFEAILDRDLEADGQVVARRGDRVTGHLEGVDPGGRVSGRAEMTLRLEQILTGENTIPLETNPITVQAESGTTDDAKTVGIAAGIGAAIGAIAGGKKGAAIGAAIGGGAGTAKVLTSRGKDATVEKEQLLSFRLEKSVEVLTR